MHDMDKTTVYLPDGLRMRLQAEARRRGTTQAALIRDAVTVYLDASPLPRPTSMGVIEDGGMDGRAARDWIHTQWDRKVDREG